eukprot:CAMPEP_0197662906 /NCGR_PEP_ID=MMETSP1338-20131121/55331_1 /TAXON_ID=43686 ORGANISM="Pelagodinium beii, Strain RCC1491" /NCGR_SAMPLE_ID=MMETSP1338 /ASSEMBLY_ACC=CAM_ASM_000754 /LENGTH=44 /DNA_ID= /DNA_START= /DNA_END= /DNA_ORIENTATION=
MTGSQEPVMQGPMHTANATANVLSVECFAPEVSACKESHKQANK